MEVLRIDAGPLQRLGYKLRDVDEMVWVFGGVFSYIGGIGALFATIAYATVNLILGIVGTLVVLALMVLPIYIYFSTKKALLYDGYTPHGMPQRYIKHNATEIWYKLNDDNKRIARPLIDKIYELWPQLDAEGERLYRKPCEERLKAMKALLEEQVATERALAEAESKLQRSNAKVLDDDVQRALDYVQSMKQVRKEFLSKHLEVSGG